MNDWCHAVVMWPDVRSSWLLLPVLFVLCVLWDRFPILSGQQDNNSKCWDSTQSLLKLMNDLIVVVMLKNWFKKAWGALLRNRQTDGQTFVISTSIVGTDIRMSKVILEFGKNKTVENSILNVVFRICFQPCYQLGHTYVQPKARGWTYICPSW